MKIKHVRSKTAFRKGIIRGAASHSKTYFFCKIRSGFVFEILFASNVPTEHFLKYQSKELEFEKNIFYGQLVIV